ncbi:Polyketide cyclase / dehydrase and lipid transport [Tistlia consotensis]|uniref:Polyketide cyclase / dehydrase and lipid transport n=1 Tax=Tistlia consotensis USBA 355 TaxID=560819 RepID=A0A1Y6CDQ6_9PROT|nr:SRPBCC family protein [Tistlia consotensis]SMF58456.1 Polyketide cyclase / dehydrase and lipid transport [Tistlia consotensis USBA 355]SNR63382.1 Polyketide cyclase / dehydrase and lipid transport [Tistlia consotensis]
MASLRKEIRVAGPAGAVWDAVRDVGALHERLVPGFVVDTRLEEGSRLVTFAGGLVVRELIVDLDEAARRLVWAAVGGRLSHHNASLQVFEVGPGESRLVWVADFLPDGLAGTVDGLMEQAAAAMRRAFGAPPG